MLANNSANLAPRLRHVHTLVQPELKYILGITDKDYDTLLHILRLSKEQEKLFQLKVNKILLQIHTNCIAKVSMTKVNIARFEWVLPK